MESYEERFINDVHAGINKVAISGTAVEKDTDHLILDDGTGTIAVILNNALVPEGEYLRIFGRVIPADEGYQLHADVLQNLTGIDVHAHRKVKEKMRKA